MNFLSAGWNNLTGALGFGDEDQLKKAEVLGQSAEADSARSATAGSVFGGNMTNPANPDGTKKIDLGDTNIKNVFTQSGSKPGTTTGVGEMSGSQKDLARDVGQAGNNLFGDRKVQGTSLNDAMKKMDETDHSKEFYAMAGLDVGGDNDASNDVSFGMMNGRATQTQAREAQASADAQIEKAKALPPKEGKAQAMKDAQKAQFEASKFGDMARQTDENDALMTRKDADGNVQNIVVDRDNQGNIVSTRSFEKRDDGVEVMVTHDKDGNYLGEGEVDTENAGSKNKHNQAAREMLGNGGFLGLEKRETLSVTGREGDFGEEVSMELNEGQLSTLDRFGVIKPEAKQGDNDGKARDASETFDKGKVEELLARDDLSAGDRKLLQQVANVSQGKEADSWNAETTEARESALGSARESGAITEEATVISEDELRQEGKLDETAMEISVGFKIKDKDGNRLDEAQIRDRIANGEIAIVQEGENIKPVTTGELQADEKTADELKNDRRRQMIEMLMGGGNPLMAMFGGTQAQGTQKPQSNFEKFAQGFAHSMGVHNQQQQQRLAQRGQGQQQGGYDFSSSYMDELRKSMFAQS